MAIASNGINSNKWLITLNRIEMEDLISVQPRANAPEGTPDKEVIRVEPLLSKEDISIGDLTISGIDGDRTSFIRTITLSSEQSSLDLSQIKIADRKYLRHVFEGGDTLLYDDVPPQTLPSMRVVKVENAANKLFYNEVRNRLDLNLDDTMLPDSVIQEDAFLRAAELQIYQQLKIDDAAYDRRADPSTNSGRLFAEKARIALAYRTAALLLISHQEIIRSEIFDAETQYRQVDLDAKYNYLIRISNDIIDDDDTPSGVPVVVSLAVQRSLSF